MYTCHIVLIDTAAENEGEGWAAIKLFFLRDVMDEILDLIESVSEGFPTYS